MVTKGNWSSGGQHTMQYTCDALLKPIWYYQPMLPQYV